MAFLGACAFFQITLIPGALLLSAVRYRGPLVRRFVLSFGLSLIANYLFVSALTVAGYYTRPVMLTVFVLELAAGVWCYRGVIRRRLSAPVGQLIAGLPATVQRWRWPAGAEPVSVIKTAGTIVLFAFALLELGRVFLTFVENWGSIFYYVDVVLSWNRWALDWFRNSLPVWPYHYPQLVPANWSISYVFMGIPLQYVAKGVMPLFMLALLLTMLDLAATTRHSGFYLAAAVAPLLYQRCRISMTDGVVDVAVSSMMFLAFACLLWARTEDGGRERRNYLVIGAVLATGAAVTKQAGLFALIAYPLLARVLVFRGESRPGWRGVVGFTAGYAGLILLVVVPFYVYAEWQIQAQLNASEVQHVTQEIYRGTPIPGRIENAGTLLRNHLGETISVLCVLLSVVALASRLGRWTIGVVVIPFGLIWAAFFSYDLRNLSVAMPFLATTVGIGAVTLGRAVTAPWTLRRLEQVRFGVALGVVAAVLASVAIFGFDWSSDRLVAEHRQLQRYVGNEGLNEQLYAVHDTQPFAGRVVTNYAYLAYLPGLENLLVFNNLASADDLAQVQKYLENPDIQYFLIPDDAFPDLSREIDGRLQRGELKQLFRAQKYLLVEKVRR